MNAHRFANQKQGGLNLSDRVWNLTGNAKKELEIIIQNRIAEGKSADSIASDITKYLNEPNRLYRRVKVDVIDERTGEKTGEKYVLSKAAREYKPGQGVYRSSYKNALRLAITECNRAYRRAEWESYQKNPLITGYRIQLSNNHTTIDPRTGEAIPLTDICDDLQGDYPKSFLWEGWHPHCRCRMIPIGISDEDLEKRWIARRDNKLDEWKPSDEITELPKELNDWIKRNEERMAKAKQLPYWIIENAKMLPLQLNQVNMLFQQLLTPAIMTRKLPAEAKKEYLQHNTKQWRREYFNKENGGYLLVDRERIVHSKVSKNERAKFDKEYEMAKVFAQNGYRIEMLKEIPGVSSPDVTINGVKADLKCISSHNNIVKDAKKAVRKQSAEIVLFEFGKETEAIYKEMEVLKRLKINAFYFFKGKEDKIFEL